MDGRPEGTLDTRAAAWWRRRPRWQVSLAALFAFYLLFRGGQGLLWLLGNT